MCFQMKYDEFLEKNNESWEKVKNTLKKKFVCEPVYNEKYLKTRKKAYSGKINTSFHNNKILKNGSQPIC